MIVVSFDPGRVTGVAIISFEKNKSTLIECSSEDIQDAGAWSNWFQLLPSFKSFNHDGKIVVAIETVRSVFPKVVTASGFKGIPARMATNLVETARVEERIAAAAKKNGFYVVTCTEKEWRAGLFGKKASAAMVKLQLPLLCEGVPKRTNIHMRDAIGVGLFSQKKYRLESLRSNITTPAV